MAALPDPTADAFLCLVDALDAEANAVTHAVVRAQAIRRRLLSLNVASFWINSF